VQKYISTPENQMFLRNFFSIRMVNFCLCGT